MQPLFEVEAASHELLSHCISLVGHLVHSLVVREVVLSLAECLHELVLGFQGLAQMLDLFVVLPAIQLSLVVEVAGRDAPIFLLSNGPLRPRLARVGPLVVDLRLQKCGARLMVFKHKRFVD